MLSKHPKSILSQFGISPKKSLGQNFLYDPGLLQKITALAELTPENDVLEIGPGLGSLTRTLAKSAHRVIAVELDQRLIPILVQQLGDLENVTIREGDILDFDLSANFESSYKVVSNVPYYITGAILRFLYSSQPFPSLIIMTVQEEVAERLIALPGDMSLLSCAIQYYATPEICFTIKAGAFWPKPDVNSAVIRLRTHHKPFLEGSDEELFFSLIQAGFGHKRKQLRKNLSGLGYTKEKLDEIFLRIGIQGTQRAEELDISDWVKLVKEFRA